MKKIILFCLVLCLSCVTASAYASNPSCESGLTSWNTSVVYSGTYGSGGYGISLHLILM